MQFLSPIDRGFLSLEKRQQPMHVAGLFLFNIPEDASENFVQKLVSQIRESHNTATVSPFNKVLKGMRWDIDRDFDFEYHFRHIALPHPGRVRELLVYVSQEHSSLLDRAKPLWECHIIEGIEGNRFAMYFKLHHAMIDGIAGMRILQKSLSKSPLDCNMVPPWHLQLPKREQVKTSNLAKLRQAFKPIQAVTKPFQTVSVVRRELQLSKEDAISNPDYVKLSQAPKTILNQAISSSRRFAAQSYQLSRFRDIAKSLNVTINDVVLAMCSGAIRSYLLQQNALPDKPLIAMVPMSIRDDDSSEGNKITMILANLGTHYADPLQRLNIIHRSVKNSKQRFKRMTSEQIMTYSLAAYAIPGLNIATGAFPRHQAFNLVISNVPGPQETLYWNGAKLDSFYPVSIVLDGQALNISLTSYLDSLGVGITACRRSIPHVQVLLKLLEEEIQSLEHVAIKHKQAS